MTNENVPLAKFSVVKWVLLPRVEEVAERRLEKEGIVNPTEVQLRNEMRVMLKEQGRDAVQGSIDDARRKGGKKVGK